MPLINDHEDSMDYRCRTYWRTQDEGHRPLKLPPLYCCLLPAPSAASDHIRTPAEVVEGLIILPSTAASGDYDEGNSAADARSAGDEGARGYDGRSMDYLSFHSPRGFM